MVKSFFDNLFKKPMYIANIRAFLARGEYDSALERAEQLLNIAQTGEAYRLRAQVHYARKSYDAALDDLDKAQTHDTTDQNTALCHTLRGMIRVQRQEPAIALSEFGKAIKASPLYARDALTQRGQLYGQMGDFARAIEDISTALRFEINTSIPHKAELRRLRGDFYREMGNYESALEDYIKAIFYNPRETQANLQAAQLYLDRKEWQAAYNLLENAQRNDPLHADQYRPLYHRAAGALNIPVQETSTSASAAPLPDGKRRHPLEGSQEYTPPPAEAKDAPEQRTTPAVQPTAPVSEPQPETPAQAAIQNALGFAQSGNLHAALSLIEDALRHAPANPQALVLRGNICFGLNKYDGALASFRRVQTTHDTDAIYAGMAGEALVLHTLGDEDDAREVWQKLIALEPAFADLQSAQKRLQWADSSIEIARGWV